MPWCVFTTRAVFDTWHATACARYGIPKAGYNAATNEPAINDQWTDAYVNPWMAQGMTRVFADVPADDIVLDGLNEVDQMVVNEDGSMTVTVGAQSRTMYPLTDDSWRKPKPPRWTDPNTDVEYDTETGRPV